MERWLGRVALVTGASSGIGAAICRLLVKEGIKVVGCARNVKKIDLLSEEFSSQNLPGQIHGIRCDLSSESNILEMFEELRKKYGKIDICINNAGLGYDAPILTGKTDQWREMIDINVMALSICTRESWKLMQEGNVSDGQFIHINTSFTYGSPVVNSSNYYAATKAMVGALAEGLRRELKAANSNAKVAQVSPGLVETEFAVRKTDAESAKKLYQTVKCLQPDDVARAVINILSAPSHVDINNIVVNSV